jgi:hypothetical protein
MNSLIPNGIRMKPVRTLLTLALPAVLCALAVAGCGSSKNAASTTTTTTEATTGTTPSGSANFSAYQSCLQSHGVSFPQGAPSGGTNGGSPPAGGIGGGAPASGRPSISSAQRKAFQACASLQPAGFGGGAGTGGGAANSNSPAFVKFQNCLKQHGVDPTGSNARGSSAFQTALSACRSLLPSQGAGGGSGFGGGAPPGGGAAGSGNSSSFAKFQACLKSHGVNTGAAGQSSAKTQAAIATCQKLLQPTGSGTTTTTG